MIYITSAPLSIIRVISIGSTFLIVETYWIIWIKICDKKRTKYYTTKIDISVKFWEWHIESKKAPIYNIHDLQLLVNYVCVCWS